MNFRSTITALILLLLSCCVCWAQDGVSTAGLARTRYLSEVGTLPTSKDVVVEDFVNYHRHEIARPKAGEAVALDVRWDRDKISRNQDAVLQVALSTSLAHGTSELPPLNLALVIDKSGSMGMDNKMVRVKEALTKLVSQLRPIDVLSIVVFDSDASVLLPATPVTDPDSINRVISQIEPGSSTNLNGGLMLGYEEALKHFKSNDTNRVILLTDGIANRGVTDPLEIARKSASFNDQGIDLCTVGVGSDVNQDFLQQLAKSGRGLFHFVANADDIQKVFVNELQSQLAPVASDPNLTIKFGSGLELNKLYGYSPQVNGHSVKVKLDNMNRGMTEAVLARFKAEGGDETPVHVRLSYWDLDRKKQVDVEQDVTVPSMRTDGSKGSEDESVAKNYCIARMAQAIHDMAADCEHQRFSTAQQVLDKAIDDTQRQYPNPQDPDITRTLGIATKYRDVLRRHNAADDRGDDGDHPLASQGQNIVVNGDFSQGNTHFMTGLGEYSAPILNSLWSGCYTIAPTFNNPQLHTLVPPNDYAAPKRPNGNEQVLFANDGASGAVVMWSSVVKCQPNTIYHISFQAISFTGSQWSNGFEVAGEEYVPSYEISIGGSTSGPQRAGCGHYGTIQMTWNSGNNRTATLTINRPARETNGGIVGITNIEMTPVRSRTRDLKD